MALFDAVTSASGSRFTTFSQAMHRGPGLQVLTNIFHDKALDGLTQARMQQAIGRVAPKDLETLRDCQIKKASPEPALVARVREALIGVNVDANNPVALLDDADMIGLTAATLRPNRTAWGRDASVVRGLEEMPEVINAGNRILSHNEVAFGTPAAGMASRAAKEVTGSPALRAILEYLGAMEGLAKDDLPPRYLYPVATNRGMKSLLGLMLENLHTIGHEVGSSIPALLMFHPEFAEFVVGRLSNELRGTWNDHDRENILIGPQSLSQRFYLADQSPMPGLHPGGHCEHPRMFATANVFQHLVENGYKYYFFSNADEPVYAPNPFLVGVADRLLYGNTLGEPQDAVVFLTENTTGQEGGGGFKSVNHPGQKMLREALALEKELRTAPKPINTLFVAARTDSLARVSSYLQTVTLMLESKETVGRESTQAAPYTEMMVSTEGHSGTEMTRPTGFDGDFKVTFVYASRAGFFNGIKKPSDMYDTNTVPLELKGDPIFGNFSRAQYVRYQADTYPSVLRGLIRLDQRIMEEVYNRGGSFLVPFS